MGEGGRKLDIRRSEVKSARSQPAETQNFSVFTRFTPGRARIWAKTFSGTSPSMATSATDEPPSRIAAERESRDIDARLAEKAREPPDETRPVLVGDIDHRGREFRFDHDFP